MASSPAISTASPATSPTRNPPPRLAGEGRVRGPMALDAGLGGFGHPLGHLGMNAKQLRDRLRRTASEAAFGADAEWPISTALRGLDATLCAVLPIRDVDQAEVQLGLGGQPEVLQRCQRGRIGAVAGGRPGNTL